MCQGPTNPLHEKCAADLGKGLRGEYTDIDESKTRCKACGHIMRGKKEMEEHNLSSGHRDFVITA